MNIVNNACKNLETYRKIGQNIWYNIKTFPTFEENSMMSDLKAMYSKYLPLLFLLPLSISQNTSPTIIL